ncbi:MAG: phosphoribosylamine--glycine ligase [Flavobacteriaceae bacterium]|jgi:phosphoribosylamine--glycine ligase
MNILLLGSGGREYTFCHQLAKSPQQPQLFIAPGNAGTAAFGTNLAVSPTDFEGLKQAAITHQIELVIVGPEVPLVEGVVDFFANDQALSHIPVIGPSKQGAELEGSKEFAKAFMQRHNIPTAAYQSFTKDTLADGLTYLETVVPPYVLKADGLAAGKGVVILNELADAKAELTAMLADAKFGEASQKVVIEEFLDGIELSCFVLTDGKSYKILPMAKDYKRIGEGDTGLNTGGMGAVSPVPFADEAFVQKIKTQVVEPTMNGLQKDGIPYVGFVFIGLIKVGDNPKVIEYNVRMGDPETQVVLPRIKNDLFELLQATATATLDSITLSVDDRSASTIVAVSGGYPESYEKGKAIHGIDPKDFVVHAGTAIADQELVTSGGRVLSATGFGDDHHQAIAKSYEALAKIAFEGMYYRKDIGFDL